MTLLLIIALVLAIFSLTPWGGGFPCLAASVILAILYLLIPLVRV